MHLSELPEDKMDLYERNYIKIEEVVLEEDTSSNDSEIKLESDSESSVCYINSDNNMIFTSLYIPQSNDGRNTIISSSMSPMDINFKNRPGRKQKLENLSYEEKVMRKKLKNREAAQTSRDRKKARMEELERQVSLLQAHNDKLLREKELVNKENKRLKLELNKTNDTESIPTITRIPTTKTTDPNTSNHITATLINGNVSCNQTNVVTDNNMSRSNAGQESTVFLDTSLQKTSGLSLPQTSNCYQTTPVSRKELLAMITVVTNMLLNVLMPEGVERNQISTTPSKEQNCPKQNQILKNGIGFSDSMKTDLLNVYQSLSNSQKNYLSQLLMNIGKEFKLIPKWWGPQQQGWNPVNFLLRNMPLFQNYLPSKNQYPLPVSIVIETAMEKVPVH